MKNLNFFQAISDIFSLRAKTSIIYVLCMFFPFFSCHVYAYTCSVKNIKTSETKIDKIESWAEYIIYFLIVSAFYVVSFVTFLLPNSTLVKVLTSPFQIGVGWYLIILLIILLLNWICYRLYYKSWFLKVVINSKPFNRQINEKF